MVKIIETKILSEISSDSSKLFNVNLKKIVTIFFMFFVINLSYAEETEKLNLAMELHELMMPEEQMKATMLNTFTHNFAPKLKQLIDKGMPQDGAQEINESANSYFSMIVEDTEFKKEMAILYLQNYTVEELNILINFYNSKLGQKTIDLLPEMFNKGQILGDKYAKKHSKFFVDQLKNILKKYNG